MSDKRKQEDELADVPQPVEISEIDAINPGTPGDNGGFATTDTPPDSAPITGVTAPDPIPMSDPEKE